MTNTRIRVSPQVWWWWCVVLVATITPRVQMTSGATCTVVTRPAAIDIRSRQTYIAIDMPDEIQSGSNPIPPAWTTSIQQSLTSSFGKVKLAYVSTYTAASPYEVGITFQMDPSYVIYTNDTVTVTLPAMMFVSPVGCTVTFPIVPSAGTIPTDLLTTNYFEVQINSGNISFSVSIVDDEIGDQNVLPIITPSPLPYNLQMSVTYVNVTYITFVLLQNASLNIPSAAGPSRITIAFPTTLMRTGISPLVGVLQTNSLQITLNPSVPSVKVEYPALAAYSGAAIPGDLLWDGTAVVYFVLQGDVWLTNTSKWNDPATSPLYVAVPYQSEGFDRLRTCTNISVTISVRVAAVRWGVCSGFAVTAVQTVTVSNWGGLTYEGSGSVEFSFNIKPATADSVSVSFAGSMFTNTTTIDTNATNATTTNNPISVCGFMNETEVRRYGISITIVTSHDIISPSVDAAVLADVFQDNPNLILSLSALTFYFINATALVVVIPPQLAYNINAKDVILVRATPSILGSHAVISRNVMSITVTQVPTPTCSYSGGVITAVQLRTIANTSVFITVGSDQICDRNAVVTDVLPQITSTTGLLKVLFNKSFVNETIMQFLIPRQTSYAISSLDFISMPMSAKIFCSLEVCTVAANQANPQAVLVAIRPSAGTLVYKFPTVDEKYMRTTPILFPVVLAGDIFIQDSFYPIFTIVGNPLDSGRGFATSIQSSCAFKVNRTANSSLAILTCLPNITYDIAFTETIRVTVPRSVVSSQENPDALSRTNTLTVTPVQGFVVASVANVTTMNESDIIAGGFVMNLTLVYERWNVTSAIGAAVRAAYPAKSSLDSDYDTSAFLRSFLPDSAFRIVGNLGQTLFITFQALPNYDIITREIFSLIFDGSAVLSGIVPLANNYTFVITASPGYFIANGSALLFGVKDLLTTRLGLQLTLFNELWVPSATYLQSELCPMTECAIGVDVSMRILTISMDPNPDYYIVISTVYPILLEPQYTVSGRIPSNPARSVMTVYLTSGLLSWTGPLSVTELAIRSGTPPVYFATIQGDLFTSAIDVRASLIRATTCAGGDPQSDPSSFCARLPILLHTTSVTLLGNNRVAKIALQNDVLFDVFGPQSVTLALDGLASQSRVAPSNTYVISVTHVAGTFMTSGIPKDLSATDLAGAPGARPIRMRISLTGDRFYGNLTRVILAMVYDGGVQVTGGPESASLYQGLRALMSLIITPEGSSLSDDGRTLTIVFVPNSNYLTDKDELVTISVPPTAVLSNITPSAYNPSQCRFIINATSATITMSPLTIRASEIRTKTATIFLMIQNGGTWQQSYVQVGQYVVNATTCSSSLIAEPNGCPLYRSTLLSTLAQQGATINGSSLVLELVQVPTYDILEPEGITISFSRNWTTADLPVNPASLTLWIIPDPMTVYAVIGMQYSGANLSQAEDGRFVPTTVQTSSFLRALSKWLNVPMSSVEIVSNVADPNLASMLVTPSATSQTQTRMKFCRVAFRLRNLVSETPYYDNSLAAVFVGMAPAIPVVSLQKAPPLRFTSMAQQTSGDGVVLHTVYYAYLSTVGAPDYIWEFIRSGTLPDTSHYVFPLSPIAVFGIVVALALFLAIGFAVRRAVVQSVTQGGLMRAKDDDDGTDGAHVTGSSADAARAAMDKERQYAEDTNVYSGQRAQVLTLGAIGVDDGDEDIARDVPILLYAGQRSSVSPKSNRNNAAQQQRPWSPADGSGGGGAGRDETSPLAFDIEAFLMEGGYKPASSSAMRGAADGGAAPRTKRVHVVSKEEAWLQAASVAAGLSNTIVREGEVVRVKDMLEDPFDHVVYPEWSKTRPGAFHPPSKFREGSWDNL